MRNSMRTVQPATADEGHGAVLCLRDVAFDDVAALLARYDLQLTRVETGTPIPGSYWGDPEAGVSSRA